MGHSQHKVNAYSTTGRLLNIDRGKCIISWEVETQATAIVVQERQNLTGDRDLGEGYSPSRKTLNTHGR